MYTSYNCNLPEYNLPEADCFSFAFACIPLQRGLSKANEKKKSLRSLRLCGENFVMTGSSRGAFVLSGVFRPPDAQSLASDSPRDLHR